MHQILLYAVSEANRRNNKVTNNEPIPQWINSFLLSLIHQDITYNIPIHREYLQDRLGETYWTCSTCIDRAYFHQDILNMRIRNGELEQAQNQIRLTLHDLERDYLEAVRNDVNITHVLRGPQGRLYLDIQVISNFFEIIQQLRR